MVGFHKREGTCFFSSILWLGARGLEHKRLLASFSLHLRAVWPWVSHLTSLYLCFLLDKKKECLSVVDIHYAFCFPCTFWTLFLFWGNFSPKGDLPPTGGIQELASPASLTSRLCCKEMDMVNVLDKSPSQLGLEVPNLQSDAPTGCGCRRETRRRWCQVQSALGRGGGAWRGICLQGLPW